MDLIVFVINLFIFCVIFAVLYWIAGLAVSLLPDQLPKAKIMTVVLILFALTALLWVVTYFQGTAFTFYSHRAPVIVR